MDELPIEHIQEIKRSCHKYREATIGTNGIHDVCVQDLLLLIDSDTALRTKLKESEEGHKITAKQCVDAQAYAGCLEKKLEAAESEIKKLQLINFDHETAFHAAELQIKDLTHKLHIAQHGGRDALDMD